MRKIVKPLILTLALVLTLCIHANTQEKLSENVIRLHVIANSNSDEDQAVKLLVRDEILNEFSSFTKNKSKEDAEKSIKENLQYFEKCANKVLAKNGFSYTASAEYGIYDFPVRTYGSVTLPAGKYYGLRIHLGNSSGKNWWCVMYPPLCFNELNAHATKTKSDEITFDIKFKISELWAIFK